MKIKDQTRKRAADCSKYCFEVVDKTDEVSSKYCFEVVDKTDEVSSKHCFEVVDRTDEVSNHIYGKAKLTWFEEIFEEYYSINLTPKYTTFASRCEREKHSRHCQEGKKRVQCNKIKGGLE